MFHVKGDPSTVPDSSLGTPAAVWSDAQQGEAWYPGVDASKYVVIDP